MSEPVFILFVLVFSICQSSLCECQSGKIAKVLVWGTPDQLKQLEVSECIILESLHGNGASPHMYVYVSLYICVPHLQFTYCLYV